MIVEGDMTIDPMTHILKDLRDLIVSKHEQGFKPILMMDANDNWLEKQKDLPKFIEEFQREDPLFQRFGQNGVTPVTTQGAQRY